MLFSPSTTKLKARKPVESSVVFNPKCSYQPHYSSANCLVDLMESLHKQTFYGSKSGAVWRNDYDFSSFPVPKQQGHLIRIPSFPVWYPIPKQAPQIFEFVFHPLALILIKSFFILFCFNKMHITI
jgi:hypothetical protein